MNWMANSKSRIQKRKSTSVNLQRSFFTNHRKMRFISSAKSKQHHPYSEVLQPPEVQRELAKLLSPKLPQQQSIFNTKRRGRENIWPSCNEDCCYVKETVDASPNIQVEGDFFPNTTKTEISTDECSKKLFAYPKRKANTIWNVECQCSFHSENNLAQEILHLKRIISEQQSEIKRLEERLLIYEREPCVGHLIKGVDSGGSRSLLAAAEEFVAHNATRDRNEISDTYGKVPCMSKNDEARVTINICARTIAYNNYNGNSISDFLGNHCDDKSSRKDCLLLNCPLDNRSFCESVKMRDHKEVEIIKPPYPDLEEKRSLHNQPFAAISHIELFDE